MELHIREVSNTHRHGEPAPIVNLARNIIEDISELCTRMAIINQHEILLEAEPPRGSDD